MIVDRFSHSGIAYSAAQGLEFEWCKIQERGLPKPDLVLYLELSEEAAAQRSAYGFERYENLEFQAKVNFQYNNLFDQNWKRVHVSSTIEEVGLLVKVEALKMIELYQKGQALMFH